LYLGGDWCIGPRIEAAWDSGTAIAEAILAGI
jgi:predicted NAD/FAD-dependent oxidoreductase